jgi:hypothetical protein
MCFLPEPQTMTKQNWPVKSECKQRKGICQRRGLVPESCSTSHLMEKAIMTTLPERESGTGGSLPQRAGVKRRWEQRRFSLISWKKQCLPV